MAVGKVTIDLEANTAKFEKQMQSFSKKLDKEIEGISKGLKKIGIAAIAASAGLGVLVKSTINANDELSKLSSKLGISTEDLTALKFAADFSGVSLGNLDGALSALTRRFNNFDKTGGGAAKDSFIELGIRTRDTEGNLRNINDVFLEVAEKVSKMEAGIRKTAIVQDIFSKSQAKIIPLLNEGADGLAAFKAEADSLGLILSGKVAKESEAFNDKLDRLGLITDSFSAQLTAKLLPSLTRVVDEMAAFSKTSDFQDTLQTIKNILDALIFAFKSVIALFAGVGIVFDQLAGNTERAEEKAKKFLVTLSKLKTELQAIGKESPEISITSKAKGSSTSFAATDTKNIDKDINKVKDFTTQVEDFYKTLTDSSTQFSNAFKNGFKSLENSLVEFTKTGKLNFRDMANSIIQDIIRIGIQQAIIAPLVSLATAGFGSIFSAGAGATASVAVGAHSGTIAGARALGGPVTGGDSFLVGERGPEIFTPRGTGRIIPNNQLNRGSSSESPRNMTSKSDVSITINAIDTQTGISFLLAQKDTIASIFNQNVSSNGSIRTNL